MYKKSYDKKWEILVNTKKKTELKYPTGAYVEFDVWVPDHDLCFEFQVTLPPLPTIITIANITINH